MLSSEVGRRIRIARERRNLTLRELAAKAGISSSFLSQAERGISELQVLHLFAISEALGVSPIDLLEDSESPMSSTAIRQDGLTITRADEALIVKVPGRPVTYRWLSGPNSPLSAEMCIVIVPPKTESRMAKHAGEEFGYVLKGSIELQFREKTYQLFAGDSFQYPGSEPHRITAGEDGAEILFFQTVRYSMFGKKGEQ